MEVSSSSTILILLLLDLFGLGLFFGGILVSHFVNLTISPLFTKLVSSKINMRGV